MSALAATGGILQDIRSTLRDPSSALAAWQPGTNPCSATAPWPGVTCTAPSNPTTSTAAASRRSAAATALPPSGAVGTASGVPPAAAQANTSASNNTNASASSDSGSNTAGNGSSSLAPGQSQAMWVSVSLSGLGLVGTLPGQLALLGDVLLELDLGGNQLGGKWIRYGGLGTRGTRRHPTIAQIHVLSVTACQLAYAALQPGRLCRTHLHPIIKNPTRLPL